MSRISDKMTNRFKKMLLEGDPELLEDLGELDKAKKALNGIITIRQNKDGIRVLLQSQNGKHTYRIWGPVKLYNGWTLTLDGIKFIDEVHLY